MPLTAEAVRGILCPPAVEVLRRARPYGRRRLVGLLFCLIALIWVWQGRRTSRIDRD